MGLEALDRLLSWHAAQPKPQRPKADLFAKLLEQDDRLAAKGFPRLSDWWRETLRAFYQSGRWQFVGRVGRRGGKSSSLCRVAVCEALHGDWHIPPGDIGVFGIVSVSRPEAAKRLVTIKAILDALGIKYGPVGDGIPGVLLDDKPIAFQVFAATIAGVSGFTGIGALCDEAAKWKDNDAGVNPAREVLSSLRPTMATQPGAKLFLVSSPFSTLDAHYEAFEAGDTAEQMVAAAPTWIANPTISEGDTKRLEPDEPTRLREYGIQPMGSTETSFFDAFAVDEAADKGLVLPLPPRPGVIITAGGDLAFVRNSATLAFAHRQGAWDSTDALYWLAEMLEIQPMPGAPLRPGEVIGQFAARLKWHGVQWMMADGHYRMSAVEHLELHKLRYADAPEGQDGKAKVFTRARVILHGGRLVIPDDPKLKRQLKEVTGRPTPGGGISISSPLKSGGAHGDLVSALVLALWQTHGREVVDEKVVTPGTPEWAHAEQIRLKREALIKAQKRDRRRRLF